MPVSLPSPESTASTLRGPLRLSPLIDTDLDAMAALLWDERVYQHIGGLPDSPALVALGLRRALAGPPEDHADQRWLNYAMRLAATGELIGRLEATVHDGIAEVAFLLGTAHWGRGHATEGLRWLHEEIARVSPGVACWATTLPENARSAHLLTRCGYVPVDPAAAPPLLTYDDGDLVFRRPAAD